MLDLTMNMFLLLLPLLLLFAIATLLCLSPLFQASTRTFTFYFTPRLLAHDTTVATWDLEPVAEGHVPDSQNSASQRLPRALTY